MNKAIHNTLPASEFQRRDYRGLLFIGDPHLEGRVPGFRKDNYAETVLNKLSWSLEYAKQEKRLPVILGDLFQLPRDNPNWLIVELLHLFDQPIATVYGNHDVHENQLGENDSLSILVEAGRLFLLSEENLLTLEINRRPILLGGTSWGQEFPNSLPDHTNQLVIWICHHDLVVPGLGWSGNQTVDPDWPFDLLINGHIHRRLEPAQSGSVTVVTPGNITRRKRSDLTRDHVPSILLVDIDAQGWQMNHLEVPHRPFDEVFHEAVIETSAEQVQSGFVTGLAELQERKTQTGAGLESFLESNLDQFEPEIADQIRNLAAQVLQETC